MFVAPDLYNAIYQIQERQPKKYPVLPLGIV
jgi:hypothetical protein